VGGFPIRKVKLHDGAFCLRGDGLGTGTLTRINPTATNAAVSASHFDRLKVQSGVEGLKALSGVEANGRQDEQDLQDGFSLRPTGAIPAFLLNPVTSFILSILFILSKDQVSI
jgi:hypothetical protein